jgi:hypothetical protein
MTKQSEQALGNSLIDKLQEMKYERYKLPGEQKYKITVFQILIDETIKEQKRKLEQDKQFKKAILQQVFV